MRISYWSSDVCSSDLSFPTRGGRIGCSAAKSMRRVIIEQFNACAIMETPALVCCDLGGKRPDPEPCGRAHQAGFEAMTGERSEARRVGKECVSKGRSGWLTQL